MSDFELSFQNFFNKLVIINFEAFSEFRKTVKFLRFEKISKLKIFEKFSLKPKNRTIWVFL